MSGLNDLDKAIAAIEAGDPVDVSEPLVRLRAVQLAYAVKVSHKPYPAMLYKATKADGGAVTYESVEVAGHEEQSRYEAEGFVAGGKGMALQALGAPPKPAPKPDDKKGSK